MAKVNRSRTRQVKAKAGTTLIKPAEIAVGVVGLGLMGTGIATCLIAAGHPVIGLELDASKRAGARRRMMAHLKQMRAEGLLKQDASRLLSKLALADNYASLSKARLIVESITEDLRAKRACLQAIENSVPRDALIGTNTSAIPPSLLQRGMKNPVRLVGIHWGDPAHTTRFMEIICGKQTGLQYAHRAMMLARTWGKEPSVLRRDIRGFITNRCMYALMREAFNLVESGYASVDDVDRSVRNDLGYWITFAGPFRFMDLTGIPAYRAVMKDLFPDLSCSKRVPRLIEQLVKSGARGVANAKGFYRYTPSEARAWEKAFLKFSYDIRALAQRYPERLGG